MILPILRAILQARQGKPTSPCLMMSWIDYNGFETTGIYSDDGSGTGIAGLTDYNVSVPVTPIAWLAIASDTLQITVTVTPLNGQSLQAVGYRMNN